MDLGDQVCPACTECFAGDVSRTQRVPRRLHCGHAVCTGCLVDLSASSSPSPAMDAALFGAGAAGAASAGGAGAEGENGAGDGGGGDGRARGGANGGVGVGAPRNSPGGVTPALDALLTLACPTCHKVTKAKTGELPIDFDRVMALGNFPSGSMRLDAEGQGAGGGAEEDEAGEEVLCVECEEVTATIECRDCEAKLCNSCFSALHPRTSRTMGNHQTRSLVVSRIAPEQESLPVCAEHPQYCCRLFCRLHKRMECDRCPFSEAHKDHQGQFQLLSEHAEGERALLLAVEQTLAHRAAALQEGLAKLSETGDVVRLLEEREVAEEVRIRAHFTKLVHAVWDREAIVVQLLKRSVAAKKERVQHAQDALTEVSAFLTQIGERQSLGDAELVGLGLGGKAQELMSRVPAVDTRALVSLLDTRIAVDLPAGTDAQLRKLLKFHGGVDPPAAPQFDAFGEDDDRLEHHSATLVWSKEDGAEIYDVEMCVGEVAEELVMETEEVNTMGDILAAVAAAEAAVASAASSEGDCKDEDGIGGAAEVGADADHGDGEGDIPGAAVRAGAARGSHGGSASASAVGVCGVAGGAGGTGAGGDMAASSNVIAAELSPAVAAAALTRFTSVTFPPPGSATARKVSIGAWAAPFEHIYSGPLCSIDVEGLHPATTYSVRARGVNQGGEVAGAWSPVMVFSTRQEHRNALAYLSASVPASSWSGEPLCLRHEFREGDDDRQHSQPLTCKSKQGIIIRVASGAVGCLEARVVRSPRPGSVFLGFAQRQHAGSTATSPLGSARAAAGGRSVRWLSKATESSLLGLESLRNAWLEIKEGETIALFVDCRKEPVLRFLVNGNVVHTQVIGRDAFGSVWCPTFGVCDGGELQLTDCPRIPRVEVYEP